MPETPQERWGTPRNIAIDKAVHVFFPGNENFPATGYDLEQRAHAEAYGGASPQAIATAEARVHLFYSGNKDPLRRSRVPMRRSPISSISTQRTPLAWSGTPP